MLFNSVDFVFYLIIVFTLYWFVFNKRTQTRNLFLLVVSYIFYGWWEWKFLILIAFSSFVDFSCGLKIRKTQSKKLKKKWLILSLTTNLGLLGVFKYFNFFSNSFADILTSIGFNVHPITLKIMLPVGISFYTFQTLSYTIDVYRGKITPCSNPITFFSYVSFFPQLVAGPIERATNLLPQFNKKKQFDYSKASQGLKLILWGLFKKVVIADYCAIIVNNVFDNYQEVSSSSLLLGIICFSFQIYGDFSGYSDIAIGTAKLFGFDLMTNFSKPYFSRDIAEFWRKWHISLSTWFRDYLYIPLGGSKGGKLKSLRNISIIFLVSGFWHGANWTFVFWGAIHTLLYIPLFVFNLNRVNLQEQTSLFPTFKNTILMLINFCFVSLAWIFFRSKNMSNAFEYIYLLFTKPFGKLGIVLDSSYGAWIYWIIILIGLEWFSRKWPHPFELLNRIGIPKIFRFSVYLLFIFIIATKYFENQQKEFIYFQF